MIGSLPEIGAFGFGLVIGWFLYFVNRYRTGEVGLGDLATVVGAIGGAVVTTLFGAEKAELFGAYGLGLATGFFLYLLLLVCLVSVSKNFTVDYFLDGRRTDPDGTVRVPEGYRQAVATFDDDKSR